MTEGRGRRRKQLLHEVKEKKGCWKFKEEALDRTLWRTRLEEAMERSYTENTLN